MLPAWLAEQGANLVLAGGMGGRAIQLFADQGVEVIVGVPQLDPESLVRAYLAGEIGAGANACDHYEPGRRRSWGRVYPFDKGPEEGMVGDEENRHHHL